MLNKEALSLNVLENFVPLLNEVGEDFVKRAQTQIGRSPQGKWTADFTNELFRFALECESEGGPVGGGTRPIFGLSYLSAGESGQKRILGSERSSE